MILCRRLVTFQHLRRRLMIGTLRGKENGHPNRRNNFEQLRGVGIFQTRRSVCQNPFTRAFICTFRLVPNGKCRLVFSRRSIRGVTFTSGINSGKISQFIVGIGEHPSLLSLPFTRRSSHVTRNRYFFLVIDGVSGNSSRELVRFLRLRLRVLTRLRIGDHRQFIRRRRFQFIRSDSNGHSALLLSTKGKVRVAMLVVNRSCRLRNLLRLFLSRSDQGFFRLRTRDSIVRSVRVERGDMFLGCDVG